VLAVRQTVVFPLTLQPLAINRTTSIESVNRALAGDRLVFLVLQNTDADEPLPSDLKTIGTIAAIRQMAKVPAACCAESHSRAVGRARNLSRVSRQVRSARARSRGRDSERRPSAGVTIATAIVSALRNQRVRDDVAMTGEITLSGLVLPVGGIREKVLAARRYGIKEFVLPARNEADLTELPSEVKDGMRFVPVATLEEVLRVALPSKAL